MGVRLMGVHHRGKNLSSPSDEDILLREGGGHCHDLRHIRYSTSITGCEIRFVFWLL